MYFIKQLGYREKIKQLFMAECEILLPIVNLISYLVRSILVYFLSINDTADLIK